jgi:hypothetical protein
MAWGRAWSGRVQELTVKAGRLEARVQGSRAVPYPVSIRSASLTKAQWRELETGMAARLGWAGQLLNGEVPQDLEETFAEVDVPLFPRRWSDLEVRCGCPDDALLTALRRGAPEPPDAGLPPWWPVGLRARPDPRWHLPDPLPPDPPERALQRLGPLELPGAPPDLEQRLTALYERLLVAEPAEDV